MEESKQHRPFLEICQEFVKVSEIATPFLNYEGTEPAINIHRQVHENHLKDIRAELEAAIEADKKAASKISLEEALEEALAKTTPEELREEFRRYRVIFEGM